MSSAAHNAELLDAVKAAPQSTVATLSKAGLCVFTYLHAQKMR